MPTKRVIAIVAVALTCGLLASYIVARYVRGREEEARKARLELRPVVVATTDIPIGARLDSSHVSKRDWPKDGVPEGATGEPEAVLGRLAKGEIARDEPILERRLFPKDLTGAPGLMSLMVPPGKRAMAVGVNEIIGVSGFILPKDRVDVIATKTNQGMNQTTETILQNIEVLAVGKRVEQEGERRVEVPTATLAVTPVEAERLALALNEGKIHLALRPVTDTKVIQLAAFTHASGVGRAGTGVGLAGAPGGKGLAVEVIRGDKRTTETFASE